MFKSTLISIIIVFSLFLLSFSGLGVGDKHKVQLFVDDDAPSSWYDDTHFSNIQDAIDNASDGSIIFVYDGTYFGEMTVNKSVELIGMNAETTIIDGLMIDNVLEIRADNVKIQSLTVNKMYPVLFGLACTKGSEGHLQCTCSEFDSHLVHQFNQSVV